MNMPHYLIKNKYIVYKSKKEAEVKFRKELSAVIIHKFGKGPFNQNVIRDIVKLSLDYYIDNFKTICLKEKSICFYQFIFWLHEQATELAYLHPHQDFSSDISGFYFSMYRRILKFILETGCEVEMISGEKTDRKFKKRIDPILDDLLFLGDMILMCVAIYAEQGMIEDLGEVNFDKDNLYVFKRRHHYEFIFKHILDELGSQLTKSLVDEDGVEDLKTAIEDSFGIKYKDVGNLISTIHKELESKGGDIVGVGWETLTVNLHRLFNIPIDIAEQFFQGLRIDRKNKMNLLDLACKPYKLNRYIYKPIIIWNVDGNDFAWFGKNVWAEAITQYATNAIPWGKAPVEWMKNMNFKAFVHKKEDDHDRWLDDAVEKKVKLTNSLYDRNVTQLNSLKGIINIDIKGLGEIDFIIVSDITRKIFICDCKHLLGRYDIVNQKNDYNAFAIGSKSTKAYNKTIANKVEWFAENLLLLQEHFRLQQGDNEISFEDYTVEGIFVINTPTFYMYNAEYRIYTINQIQEVINGDYEDPTFMLIIEDEKGEKLLKVNYPYFQKPNYFVFDPFKD
jgi:hypothetical protein